ncbi:MAG: acylphosphatase [Bacteroidetes bacterium]|jgi:acylphosphatase|nr:acylphosphatase [Bacteroidota bacterium]
MKQRIHITVSGLVQGVFFRKYTANKCIALGILGSIENLANGNVFIDAVSDDSGLKELIKWCWSGSPFSNVSDVHTQYVELGHQPEGFIIKR